MKILGISLLLLGILSTSGFSQINQNFKTDPDFNELPSVLEESWNFENKFFIDPSKLPNLQTPSELYPADKTIEIDKSEKLSSDFAMPTLIPQGSFHMKIVEPDSSVQYRMPVKKF